MWRFSYTLILFFVGCAIIALATQPDWPRRIILFFVMTVPLAVWTFWRMQTKR